jgi:hypothetical protein
LAVTLSMVWTIVVSNVITVAICFLFLKHLVRITQVRGALIIPFILMLIAVGAFAEKNVFEDIMVVLVFGALGWVMGHFGWPRPALLLGLVLGPLAENKLFLSTDNYGLAWLIRPGVLGLIAVIAAGLLVPIVAEARRRRRGDSASPAREATAEGHRGGLRLDGATVFSLVIALVFAWALWESRTFGVRAGLFPWAVAIPGLVLALAQLGRDLAGRRTRPASAAAAEAGPEVPPEVARQRSVEMCIWIAIFWLAFWLLGFSLATLLATLAYLKLSARERWPISVVLSLFSFAFVYGIFEKGLGVPFPPGQLFVWLGLAV